MASSVVFVQRKNQSRVERVEIAGGDVPVATLRQLVATNNHLDVREVELSTPQRRILTDGCPDVPRQSTVLMRRKPVATQGQRLLGQQTRAWRRRAPARPTAAQTPLSQQPQSAAVFGIRRVEPAVRGSRLLQRVSQPPSAAPSRSLERR